MDVLTIVAEVIVFLMIFGGMLIRPYLYYRDVVSGAITYDSNDSFIIQGCVFGGVAIYLLISIGFSDTLISMVIITLFLISFGQFYFSAKAWLWNKNNK